MKIIDVVELDEASARRGRPIGSIAKIREVHHFVAAMYAKGHKPPAIAAVINRSPATVRLWLASPAFAELVASYASTEYEAKANELDYRFKLRQQASTLSLESLVEQLEEDPRAVPIAQRIKLAGDSDDRTGLGRQETRLNINADMGTRLDRATEEAAKTKAVRIGPFGSNVVQLKRRD